MRDYDVVKTSTLIKFLIPSTILFTVLFFVSVNFKENMYRKNLKSNNMNRSAEIIQKRKNGK